MKREELRNGNWACLRVSPDYQTRLSARDLPHAKDFEPIAIHEKFLVNFRHDSLGGKDVYFNEAGGNVISLTRKDVSWTLVVRTSKRTFEGDVEYLHEAQNILADCGIYSLI